MGNYNFCILLLFSLIDVFLYGIEGIDLIKFLFSCLVYAYMIIIFYISDEDYYDISVCLDEQMESFE